MPAPPALRLSGIDKRFGDHRVLSDVEIEVAAGTIVALIGPSGSGKSTLLRCINMLEVPDAGRIELDGRVVLDLAVAADRAAAVREAARTLRRATAMVFQQFNLFPHMTALQNVALGPMRVGRLPAGGARRLAQELLDRVGLGERARSYPRDLSGGQRQRVAIARALALRTPIMLFDEPTSALDPETVQEVLAVIREHARDGRTKLIVTHEMSFALEVADRVVMLDGGRIVEDGTPSRILSAPDHPRTRAFLQKLRGVPDLERPALRAAR